MNEYVWILYLILGLLALNQLAGIARSLDSMAAMLKRLLAHNGIQWEAEAEPSTRVKELALKAGGEIEAIKAYREQTGLGLKEARKIIASLRQPR